LGFCVGAAAQNEQLMIKFPKAVTITAISVLLVSAGIIAAPTFALEGTQSDTALKADTIQIDAGVIAAEKSYLKNATQPNVVMNVSRAADVVFIPGNGDGPEMEFDADEAQTQGEFYPDDDTPSNSKPVKTSAATLAELVRMQDTGGALTREEQCLAGAVYFESKSESLAGQLAVAKVVMARASSGRFPSSICGVVYQKSQFSFIRGNRMPPIDKNGVQWKNAMAITNIALSGSWKSPVEGALFFHARRVSPGWKLTRVGIVENHVFYR
jgi:Cell Wall Hydrolase